MTLDTQTIYYLLALLGGTLPALVWLSFWLREDKEHPEPRGLLLISFIAGMAAVPLTLPFEAPAYTSLPQTGLLLWLVIATTEELLKYGAARVTALSRKAFDEPIDAIIYMLTIALGFSAAENALFIFKHLSDGVLISDNIINSNFRFIGASLLHMVSSATIGTFVAFSFYKKRFKKFIYLVIGIVSAILIHTSFNFFIMEGELKKSTNQSIYVFLGVWLAVILLILIFEKVKRIYPIGAVPQEGSPGNRAESFVMLTPKHDQKIPALIFATIGTASYLFLLWVSGIALVMSPLLFDNPHGKDSAIPYILLALVISIPIILLFLVTYMWVFYKEGKYKKVIRNSMASVIIFGVLLYWYITNT